MSEQQQYPTREQLAETLRGVYDEAAAVNDHARRVPFDIDYTASDAVLALFPQPTPSAVRCERCGGTGYQGDGPNTAGVPRPDCTPATPPSIADMAPGTTREQAGMILARLRLAVFPWSPGDSTAAAHCIERLLGIVTQYNDLVQHIDPSTIRDVTPPESPNDN